MIYQDRERVPSVRLKWSPIEIRLGMQATAAVVAAEPFTKMLIEVTMPFSIASMIPLPRRQIK